jgi:phenylalanyl-tRNA synthetase beta chain
MKISIAWLFDHIDADWKKIDLAEFTKKFNTTTAEIEAFYSVKFDTQSFTLATVTSVNADRMAVHSDELSKDFELPTDKEILVGQNVLIKKDPAGLRRATLADLQCEKEGLVPAVYVEAAERAGGWKKHWETDDYILEVDNKSITHRPDMWSHRGFAREVAALLGKPLRPLDQFLIKKTVITYDKKAPAAADCPVAISVNDQTIGKRFAGLYCHTVENRPSSFSMAYRLARTGNRPLNALIDTTNYVMLDMGQPMHAFDAAQCQTIEARCAKQGEKLVLLDGQTIELTVHDYVITDGAKPVALAGVMGGKESGISATTKDLFLEAAHFDAGTIRRTAVRHKIRTEASARFEKTLDPNQNIAALERFLKLLDEQKIRYTAASAIASIGQEAQPLIITMTHDLIERRLGATVTAQFIEHTLTTIGFGVERSGSEYSVTVPTFRCSKDVTIQEDLIEEIGRFFGYAHIPHALPVQERVPFDLRPIMRVRLMKKYCAQAMRMHEVYNYAIYDEHLLRELKYEPTQCVVIKNPVSEDRCRLVTSLIPHLIGNVRHNSQEHEQLRFFEWGRVWTEHNNKVTEQKSLAGILFDRKCALDFYEAKDLMTQFFAALDMPLVWKKAAHVPMWYANHQTAALEFNGVVIGYAGKMNSALIERGEGDAFVFELNGDALVQYTAPLKRYAPLAKYPGVRRDISMLAPLEVTLEQVIAVVQGVDERIHDVLLVDLFYKDEWKDKKSLTIRLVIQDETKTLTSEDAEQVCHHINKQLEQQGVIIR